MTSSLRLTGIIIWDSKRESRITSNQPSNTTRSPFKFRIITSKLYLIEASLTINSNNMIQPFKTILNLYLQNPTTLLAIITEESLMIEKMKILKPYKILLKPYPLMILNLTSFIIEDSPIGKFMISKKPFRISIKLSNQITNISKLIIIELIVMKN